MDQEVVVRVLSLTRTLSVDTLFGFVLLAFLLEFLCRHLLPASGLPEGGNENHNRASLIHM